jgi:methionyl-tRNA formyltransferase
MTERLDLVFAGTPQFAVPTLRALCASGHRVRAVYTQPDRCAGRGRRPRPSPVKTLALECGLDVEQPPTLREEAVQAGLRALGADALIVVAYGLLLPPAVLAIPRLGCLNVHASLLPRWRGAAPIPRALLAGDSETGVSILQMEKGLDTGPILARSSCSIGPDDTAARLAERLAAQGADLLLETLDRLVQGGVQLLAQDPARACYAPKLSKAEAVLDWRHPAPELERRVRAFDPWPVAQTCLEDGTVLRIWRARALPLVPGGPPPGSVLDAGAAGIDVAAGEGVLRLLEMQLPGGRRLDAGAFLAGHAIAGTRLGVAG